MSLEHDAQVLQREVGSLPRAHSSSWCPWNAFSERGATGRGTRNGSQGESEGLKETTKREKYKKKIQIREKKKNQLRFKPQGRQFDQTAESIRVYGHSVSWILLLTRYTKRWSMKNEITSKKQEAMKKT